MIAIYLSILGYFSFVSGVIVLGSWLRRHPTLENAEKSSRIMHFLFFAGLVTPGLIIIFYPGLTNLDALFGIPSLPIKPLFIGIGILIAVPGLYFFGMSNQLLRSSGQGANAFRLTQKIVQTNVYQRTRNPMSLGYYLLALSLGLVSGSTFLTLTVLVGIIPAHIFFLKYFEEVELALRFGDSYTQYKHEVPFLIPKLPVG